MPPFEINRRSRHWLRIQGIAFIFLLLAAAGLAFWLTHRISLSWDWTAMGRNSLTRSSRRITRSLDQPVKVDAFVRTEDPLRASIRHLVDRYHRVNPRIQLHFINPDIHLNQVRRFGITADGELVIRYAGRQQTLTTLSQRSLTDALFRLMRSQNLNVRFVTGNGEPSLTGSGPADLRALDQALVREGFRTQTLNLATAQIPEKTALLILDDPTARLLAPEVATLVQAVKSGQALLWLMPPGRLHGLTPLARALGIRFLPGTIVDAESRLFGISNPTWLVLTSYPINPVTESLHLETLFPDAGALARRPNRPWSEEPLLESRPLPVSWLAQGPLTGTLIYNPKQKDRPGPLPIGFLLNPAPSRTTPATQRVAVLATNEFWANAFLNEGGNLTFSLDLINWLTSQNAALKLHEPQSPDRTLILTPFEEGLLGAGFLIGLPLLLFAAGIAYWIRRRRR